MKKENQNLYEQLGAILERLTELKTEVFQHNQKIDSLLVSMVEVKTNLNNHLAHHKKDMYIILSVFGALLAAIVKFLFF